MEILLIIFIPNKTRSEKAIKKSDMKIRNIFKVLKKRINILFFIEMTLFGSAIAIVERLLFIYVMKGVDDGGLGGDTSLCGYIVGITVIFELPIFYYAKKLLKFPGRDGLYLISMTSYFTRVYGYTLLTYDTRYYILALESLHGFCFATMWISSVDYAKEISPIGWEATF